eukprot:TRINITY_DN8479_c0_g2_i1.p1 TRINITY_DN8479_c0_g2~~TRINITY_DN8479_c0_g2_i1.p1  ORF type:complete len:290 (+),score=37.00 TRINITY_DN8479_c0_g2_i1:23-871(+)
MEELHNVCPSAERDCIGCSDGLEEKNDLLKSFISSTESYHQSVDETDRITFIDKNNNHSMSFSASQQLTRDIWQSILERLSAPELARAACVCSLWNSIASESQVQINAFKSPWKIKEIVGIPSSRSFWHDNSISRFAISHRLKRSDTLVGLALKYQVHASDIRRLNNMMSDHGIYSRERLLIPISNPEILKDGTCYIELDIYAKREVAVLYLNGFPNPKSRHLTNNISEKTRRRLVESLKRSLQADDATAEYYLSISNDNIRAAFQQYSEDLNWERRHRHFY